MYHLSKLTLVVILLSVGVTATTCLAASTAEAIIERMFEMYKIDRTSHTIELLSNPFKSAEVTPDEIALRPLTAREPLGLFSAIVTISEGGQKLEQQQVRMKIRRFAEVLVATDRIGSREEINSDRVTTRRMDITTLAELPIFSHDQLAGYRAKRNIRRGKIITAAALELIPDVERGTEVTVIYSDGLCRITTSGIALQTGVAGDYIKVKNKGTKKVIIARVVDGTAVAIDP